MCEASKGAISTVENMGSALFAHGSEKAIKSKDNEMLLLVLLGREGRREKQPRACPLRGNVRNTKRAQRLLELQQQPSALRGHCCRVPSQVNAQRANNKRTAWGGP